MSIKSSHKSWESPIDRERERIFKDIGSGLLKISKEMTRFRSQVNDIRWNNDLTEESRRLAERALKFISSIEREAEEGSREIIAQVNIYLTPPPKGKYFKR